MVSAAPRHATPEARRRGASWRDGVGAISSQEFGVDSQGGDVMSRHRAAAAIPEVGARSVAVKGRVSPALGRPRKQMQCPQQGVPAAYVRNARDVATRELTLPTSAGPSHKARRKPKTSLGVATAPIIHRDIVYAQPFGARLSNQRTNIFENILYFREISFFIGAHLPTDSWRNLNSASSGIGC